MIRIDRLPVSAVSRRFVAAASALVALAVSPAAAELPLEQVVNGDFEGGFSEDGRKAFGWNRFGKCFRVEKNAGDNGTTGLVWRNDDPKHYEIASSPVRLVPEETYEMRARYMTVNLKPAGPAVGLCIGFQDADGKYIGGIYKAGARVTGGEWKTISHIGKVPSNAVTMTMSPYVDRGYTGEVHYDSFSVRRVVRRPATGLHVGAYRDLVADGPLEIVAALDIRSDEVADYEPSLSLPTADGGTRDLTPTEYIRDWARFKVDAGELPFGKSTLVFSLRERGTGKVLDGCSARCTVERVRELPSRKVYVDRLRRLIVDGKPFFPLGMYWNDADPTDEKLAAYAAGPFNCLLNYQQMTRAQMDACHRHGLKLIYSIEGVYSPGGPFTNEQHITSWTRRVVRHRRDHPALLAWYMNDERGLPYIPQLERRYRLVRETDPDHPTYSVLCQLDTVHRYIGSFDVIGTDPYPVGNPYRREPGDDYAFCARSADASMAGGYLLRPVWQVPQTFDWELYNKGKSKRPRMPSAAEMKNMFWQAIACGANGLIGYAYHCLERMDHKTPFETAWAMTCEAAGEIRRFIPVILADGTPPAVTGGNAAVRVRAWRDGQTVYVLAVNTLDKPSRATLSVGCSWTGVRCELGTAPSAAGEGKLDVTLPALGASIWRLD